MLRFLSTLSLRRATTEPSSTCTRKRFLSTLSLRRATTDTVERMIGKKISIHALLAESDFGRPQRQFYHQHFYPRSPCGERPKSPANSGPCIRYFYPRSPCGERLQRQIEFERYSDISIHALLAESDKCCFVILLVVLLFLSTLSLRRATIGAITYVVMTPDFYPRSPCGERPRIIDPTYRQGVISIHALLAESDSHRSPRSRAVSMISIHALLAESDPLQFAVTVDRFIFLSTLSLRRAT